MLPDHEFVEPPQSAAVAQFDCLGADSMSIRSGYARDDDELRALPEEIVFIRRAISREALIGEI
jgi:hypothetical protein